MKLFILLSVAALTFAVKVKFKSKLNPISEQNRDLFKYSPDDKYSLPEDIDDYSEKPPIIFLGNHMLAKISKLENFNSGSGKFKLNLKTENGIEVAQAGKLKDEKTFIISGSYIYTGADGKRYRVRYTADELGYHPITELDIELPDPKEALVTSSASKINGLEAGTKGTNGFQFLKRPISERNNPNDQQQKSDKALLNNNPTAAASNTVVHNKGQGYSFQSDITGFGHSNFGTGSSANKEVSAILGSASLQSTVSTPLQGHKTGFSTKAAFAHAGLTAANNYQAPTIVPVSKLHTKVSYSATKKPQTISTFAKASKRPETVLRGNGISVNGGSYTAGKAKHEALGNHAAASGVVNSLSNSSGFNSSVFNKAEDHGGAGYKYVPPTNKYLPPSTSTHKIHRNAENVNLPPFIK